MPIYILYLFVYLCNQHKMSTHNYQVYIILMTLEVGLIEIIYQGSNTNNPFQQSSSPTLFLFLTSLFSHAVSTIAGLNFPTTRIVFHFSGVVGCEILLWILLPKFWNWYIINLFLLFVTLLCFFNYILNITKLFLATHPNAAIAHPPNPEPHDSSASLPLDL